MRQDNDCPGLRTRRWEEFCQSLVNHTLSLAGHVSECASRWCKDIRYEGSYSFVSLENNKTMAKLLLDPKTPRLLVGFRRDIPGAWDFAQRLRPTIECYSINKVPFHMVQADPVRESDEICETMTEFLRVASKWASSDASQRG